MCRVRNLEKFSFSCIPQKNNRRKRPSRARVPYVSRLPPGSAAHIVAQWTRAVPARAPAPLRARPWLGNCSQQHPHNAPAPVVNRHHRSSMRIDNRTPCPPLPRSPACVPPPSRALGMTNQELAPPESFTDVWASARARRALQLQPNRCACVTWSGRSRWAPPWSA